MARTLVICSWDGVSVIEWPAMILQMVSIRIAMRLLREQSAQVN
jgi:hypothetical protein